MKRYFHGFLLSGLIACLAACAGAAPPASSNGGAAGSKPAAVSVLPRGASGSAPAALFPFKIAYASISGTALPLWIAADAGLFRDSGLDASLVAMTVNSSALMAALSSGEVNLVLTDGGTAADGRAAGADVRVVAQLQPVSPYGLAGAPEIKSTDDLKGRKIGVQSLSGSDAVATKLLLSKLGLDWKTDVSLISVGSGGSSTRVAALLNGTVQATVVDPRADLPAIQPKGFHLVADLAALGVPALSASLAINGAYATAHPEAIQKFTDAIVRAIAREKTDKPYGLKLLERNLKNDDDAVMGPAYDFFQQAVPSLPYPQRPGFEATLPLLSDDNPKLKEVDLSALLDPSFVRSAAERKVGQ